jgi:hypothetical protein
MTGSCRDLIEVIPRHLPGRIKWRHEKPQSVYLPSRPRCKPSTSRVQVFTLTATWPLREQPFELPQHLLLVGIVYTGRAPLCTLVLLYARQTCTAKLWIPWSVTGSGSDGNWLENYTSTCTVQYCDGVWWIPAPAIGPGYATRTTHCANSLERQK